MGLGNFFRNSGALISNFWSRGPMPTAEERQNYGDLVFDYLKQMGLSGSMNTADETINAATAMRVATVFTCVRIKSDALAQMPANVCKRTGDQTEIDYNHSAQALVHIRPNPWQTPFQFWKWVEQQVELEGDAFVGINRAPNMNPIEFVPLAYTDMDVRETKDGWPVYRYKGNFVNYFDILHFKAYSRNGKLGISTIAQNAETIGNAIKLKKFANRSISSMPPVYATSELTAFPKGESKTQFSEYMAKQMSNWYDRGDIPFFTHGFELKSPGLKPTEAAYLDQISASKEDIFGIFGVPPGLGGSFKTGVTYSNLEQQNLQFLIYSLNPVIVNIEQELNYKLFTGAEAETHYIKFNEKALLRTDALTQMQLLQGYFKIGVYSRNEIRELLDMNPVPDGDEYYIEGNNMVSTDDAGDLPDDDEEEDDEDETPQRNGVKINGHHKHKLNGHVN